MAESKSVVIAALIANGAIAVMKFVGFLLTQSPAMLSETFHSISDTGNQVFLLIGIRYSKREADERHPFGYGKAQFFYSFLVSVLLFGIAGWESANHGFHKIQEAIGGHGVGHTAQDVTLAGYTFPPVYVNYVVLLGAIVFEAWAFKKARASMKRQIEQKGWSGYREAFRKTSHVTTLTAFTEDFIAGAGAGIALLGVFISRQTGDPIYDAVAATLIGVMLMGFAIALAWENKRLLLGESVPEGAEGELRDLVAAAEGVDRVIDFNTTFHGPGQIVVVADVDFQDDLTAVEISERIDEIEAALQDADQEVIAAYIEVEEAGESSVV